MNFPTGPRQPSQTIAEDLIAACTPPDLMGRMHADALEIGSPIHEKFYVGHAMDVNDPPLSRFFMYQLERPRHYENFEIPECKWDIILLRSPNIYHLDGDYLASLFLRISGIFDSKSPSTLFRLETYYTKVSEGYEEKMINMDYHFLANLKRTFDDKIRLKFPPRKSPLACNFNIVK